MNVLIEQVQTPAAFRRLHEMLVAYERDLPPLLRHDHEPNLDEVERRYRGDNAAFVARVGDRYAGCIAVVALDRETAIVQRLFVQPAHRGHGAARALVQAVIGYAREREYKRLVLDTDAQRLNAAYALYRSLGFRECEPYGEVDYASPTFMDLPLG